MTELVCVLFHVFQLDFLMDKYEDDFGTEDIPTTIIEALRLMPNTESIIGNIKENAAGEVLLVMLLV